MNNDKDLTQRGVENEAKGKVREAKGAVRDNVGDITGNTSQELKGKAERVAGKVQQKVGEGERKRDETVGPQRLQQRRAAKHCFAARRIFIPATPAGHSLLTRRSSTRNPRDTAT